MMKPIMKTHLMMFLHPNSKVIKNLYPKLINSKKCMKIPESKTHLKLNPKETFMKSKKTLINFF
jgi:hypothetical protein